MFTHGKNSQIDFYQSKFLFRKVDFFSKTADGRPLHPLAYLTDTVFPLYYYTMRLYEQTLKRARPLTGGGSIVASRVASMP